MQQEIHCMSYEMYVSLGNVSLNLVCIYRPLISLNSIWLAQKAVQLALIVLQVASVILQLA